jgi:hypothetical protein
VRLGLGVILAFGQPFYISLMFSTTKLQIDETPGRLCWRSLAAIIIPGEHSGLGV